MKTDLPCRPLVIRVSTSKLRLLDVHIDNLSKIQESNSARGFKTSS